MMVAYCIHKLVHQFAQFSLDTFFFSDVTENSVFPLKYAGELEQERYFFSQKELKYRNGNQTKRTTNSGYWKATGSDKKIVSSKRNQLMGMKKTLVFYRGKSPQGVRTEWIMHEYRLVNAETTACFFPQIDNSTQVSINPINYSSRKNSLTTLLFCYFYNYIFKF